MDDALDRGGGPVHAVTDAFGFGESEDRLALHQLIELRGDFIELALERADILPLLRADGVVDDVEGAQRRSVRGFELRNQVFVRRRGKVARARAHRVHRGAEFAAGFGHIARLRGGVKRTLDFVLPHHEHDAVDQKADHRNGSQHDDGCRPESGWNSVRRDLR